jgi:hypothetical protein
MPNAGGGLLCRPIVHGHGPWGPDCPAQRIALTPRPPATARVCLALTILPLYDARLRLCVVRNLPDDSEQETFCRRVNTFYGVSPSESLHWCLRYTLIWQHSGDFITTPPQDETH